MYTHLNRRQHNLAERADSSVLESVTADRIPMKGGITNTIANADGRHCPLHIAFLLHINYAFIHVQILRGPESHTSSHN